MLDRKSVPISELMVAANMELIRLDFKSSTIVRHSKEFRNFSNYCEESKICMYDAETGLRYFQHCYGLDVSDSTVKLTKQQLDTRCSIRFLDDIFQFGYALRYRHPDYSVPLKYVNLLEEYLAWCDRNNGSPGTIRVKRTKIRQFFCFLDGRGIAISNLTAADISDFMTTLCRYHRATIYVFSSVLRDFFRYLHESEVLENDLSVYVPRPKIYVEESVPETWTPEEVRQLLSAVDRNNAIGKRDYAMLLMAILLGMRAGDICALKFKNLDWNQKLITYTQQKTKKVNTLPLLPVIGDAIIDYLKNGRLDSKCDNVFIRHIHPYGEFQSSTALSENLKKYMRYAGLNVKKRKVAHSLRHTLASSLLYDGTPLMTISNILGHNSPKTTSVYTKVNLPALRKCALSYGERREIV
jgi:site-specific recombinase XerD